MIRHTEEPQPRNLPEQAQQGGSVAADVMILDDDDDTQQQYDQDVGNLVQHDVQQQQEISEALQEVNEGVEQDANTLYQPASRS